MEKSNVNTKGNFGDSGYCFYICIDYYARICICKYMHTYVDPEAGNTDLHMCLIYTWNNLVHSFQQKLVVQKALF